MELPDDLIYSEIASQLSNRDVMTLAQLDTKSRRQIQARQKQKLREERRRREINRQKYMRSKFSYKEFDLKSNIDNALKGSHKVGDIIVIYVISLNKYFFYFYTEDGFIVQDNAVPPVQFSFPEYPIMFFDDLFFNVGLGEYQDILWYPTLSLTEVRANVYSFIEDSDQGYLLSYITVNDIRYEIVIIEDTQTFKKDFREYLVDSTPFQTFNLGTLINIETKDFYKRKFLMPSEETAEYLSGATYKYMFYERLNEIDRNFIFVIELKLEQIIYPLLKNELN